MQEFWKLLKQFDLKGIFFDPTANSFLQFFRYIFVGGIATVADWGMLFLLTEYVHINHLISAIFAFVAGLAVNFILSKMLVFKMNEVRTSAWMEFVGYAIIGIIGLGITELIMYLLTDCLNTYYMISKAVATVIVLIWNYTARKKIIYK